MQDTATLQAGALREAVLGGRLAEPGAARHAAGFARFLQEDRAALSAWFGPAAAAAHAQNPHALRGLVDRELALIDELISAQLDAILHDARLQRLEGSWRGLAWLVAAHKPGRRLRVCVLGAAWRELDRDLSRAIEFDQSNLFRLVYENEFGRAGGEPFGLLVVDHELRHLAARRELAGGPPVDDVQVATGLAAIATSAFVPVVLAASPALLGVDRFEELALAHNVADVIADRDHTRWRMLAGREEARFLCVTLPRVLARPRWQNHPGCSFYEESSATAATRCWSVAGYAFAAIVGRSHLAHNWPADVRGVAQDRQGGGLVLGLAAEHARVGAATRIARQGVDLALTDRQERDLVLAGFMPLNTLPHADAAFASVHSLQARLPDAPGRDPGAAQANRRISAQISAMLCVSRFAHHIKIIGRELTGSFATQDDIERRLQAWLMRYVNASPSATARAEKPLLSGRVQVHALEGRPGSFGCVVHLQPFYQLDDVSTIFRLVTGFTAPGRASGGQDVRTIGQTAGLTTGDTA